MAFDSIEELLKLKNVTLPTDPNDPNKKNEDEEDKVKPFGNTPVDPLTGNPIYGASAAAGGLRATIGDQHAGHKAIILKRSFMDGKVKLYSDSKGIAERTEILVEGGKVVVYKDYDLPGHPARYKKIDVYSVDDELLGAINMYPRDKFNPNPVYRFFYEQSEIGHGNGDIALFVAQALVGRSIQSRSGAGTSIDGEIITTIKNILHTKR